jgi:hypothetical protein
VAWSDAHGGRAREGQGARKRPDVGAVGAAQGNAGEVRADEASVEASVEVRVEVSVEVSAEVRVEVKDAEEKDTEEKDDEEKDDEEERKPLMPKTGYFVLHSNFLPTVTAGQYDLVTTQDGLPFTVADLHTHVTVAAPRFVMPTDQILSSFPPANAEGAFGDRLPQIVLKRRTLPWERNPAEKIPVSPIPWLALVVVAEGEATLSTATPIAQCVTAGTKLLDLATDKDVDQGLYLAVTETVVKKIFPCKDDLELLVHVREVDINDTELANGDDDGWLAVVLANRLPVFDTAANKPVRYMACLVNIEGQLDALPPPVPPASSFSWALAQDWTVLGSIDPKIGPDPRVMGGIELGGVSLPVAGGMPAGVHAIGRALPAITSPPEASPQVGASIDGAATMHEVPVDKQWASMTEKVSSVALDPDAKRLVRDAMASGFRYPIEAFAREKVLRFPVLAHWSFTTSEGATFETLMEDLDVGLLGMVPTPAADALPPARPAPEVVETGHIGLGQRARRGDAMRAWYRGPFVPFPTLRDPAGGGPLLAHAADQLRRVVPDGREDLALAAAFEIGRLLALSQLSVVSALLRFRNEQFGAGRVRELLASLTPFQMPPLVDTTVDLGRFVAAQMVGELVKNPADTIGPRRPIADPGRELAVQGDLDQIIATGLGLDLDTVLKTSDEIGIVAAVALAQVPIANVSGTIKLDAPTLAGMRSALMSELSHTLGIAAPQLAKQFTTTKAQRTTRRAREPDALDKLLGQAAAHEKDEEEKS